MVATPFNSTFDFIETNRATIHSRLEGNPEHPVLALVNMASHNLHSWEPVAKTLLAHFQLLRFDIRGTGKSTCEDQADFSFTAYAEDLVALMDHYGIARAMVLGVAYGARTAARFALAHPERLTLLCLADVSLRPPVEQSGQRALAARAHELLLAAGEPAPTQKKYWRFYEDRTTALHAHTAHEHEPDLTEHLAEVTQPTLVLCGRQDMNLEEAQRIAAVLPAGALEIMEMTGHGSPLFRPLAFAGSVVRFATANGLLNP